MLRSRCFISVLGRIALTSLGLLLTGGSLTVQTPNASALPGDARREGMQRGGASTTGGTQTALSSAEPAVGPISFDNFVSEVANGRAESLAPLPIKVLIITGDNVSAHAWRDTSRALKDLLEKDGRIAVDITSSPSRDLTDDNLAKYDVLLLNYKDTQAGAAESRWSDSNKQAFLKSVRDGKGLVAYHFASSAFTKPNWDDFEKAVAGGWRSQGFHGPKHVFTVKKTDLRHPISDNLPAQFEHAVDELYQNSMIMPGSVVLATAYSDPKKDRGTGKDEPVIWVNTFGKGRVYENVLGHDLTAMANPNYQEWMRRGVIWAATGAVK